MDPIERFHSEIEANIEGLGNDRELRALSLQWIRAITPHKWAYNFSWFGRPAIQFPNDAWAMQELIWNVRPDLIIETGIAHGGSLVFSASMLALLDYCDAVEHGQVLDPAQPGRKVLGIDIDIRAHNRSAIEAHPMAGRIEMLEGSSTDGTVIEQTRAFADDFETILVCLDSNHTHEHVLGELEAYAPLVSAGSYIVVFDTLIEDMPEGFFPDRPWGRGNNPKTAVAEFLRSHPEFEIDASIPDKLQITVAPDGFLRRVG